MTKLQLGERNHNLMGRIERGAQKGRRSRATPLISLSLTAGIIWVIGRPVNIIASVETQNRDAISSTLEPTANVSLLFSTITVVGESRTIPESTLELDRKTRESQVQVAFKESDDISVLINDLTNKDATVRLSAVTALASIGPDAKEATPALITVLNDQDASVRGGAARALGKIGFATEAVIPALMMALEDQDEYVRVDVANALGYIGPAAEEAVPVLKHVAVHDPVKRVRSSARRAVSNIVDKPISGDPPLVESGAPGIIERIREITRPTPKPTPQPKEEKDGL